MIGKMGTFSTRLNCSLNEHLRSVEKSEHMRIVEKSEHLRSVEKKEISDHYVKRKYSK